MFEVALFDWDGTLADTRNVILVSFRKALELIHHQVSDEYIERRIGIGAAETFREILRLASLPVDEEVVKRLVERKSAVQVELSGQVSLFEGARELLETLHGKVKRGLASMNNREVIFNLLEAKGLSDCFDVVLTAESISRSKPDPEIFLKTANQLGATPQRCVVLEDSVFGVKAAKSAGMGCIGVSTGVYGLKELEAEKADLIVESLKDPRVQAFILH